LRGAGIRIVMGNCEESLAAGSEDCGCGFAEGSACAIASSEWYAYANDRVDRASRAWMAALPRRLDIDFAGRRLAVVHGGVTSINRFVFASSGAAIAEELTAAACDGVIAGHCGLPFTRVLDGQLWHNAGAIGMPANDGTPRVWYSLLVPTEAGVRIEHHALDYDHRAAAAKMRRCGLLPGYAACLGSGLWPSCDVLTAVELAQRGRRLEPTAVLWQPAIELASN
jgi:predicted phosphodiesterase